MPKLYLTNDIIENLVCPSEKDQELYWDHPRTLKGGIGKGAIPGLGLRVTVNGIKTFVHAYEHHGKRRRQAIGRVGRVNVSSARLMVRQREAQLAANENPDAANDNHQPHKILTVRDVVEQYWVTFHDKSEGYRKQYAYYIAPWVRRPIVLTRRRSKKTRAFGALYGDRPFDSIKPLDIQNFLEQYENACGYNSAFSVVCSLYNWAIRMQFVDMRSPCTPFKKKKYLRQRRDYTPEDIQTLARLIFKPQPEFDERLREYCRYMGILFLTMARPVELRLAEFDHFDLKQLVWHKHNTKGIKLSNAVSEYAFRSVPIHPRVGELIQVQRKLYPNAKYVFPNLKDESQPRTKFVKEAARFKENQGVTDFFQLYDLKRISISLMLVGQGVRREDVSHYVDHKGNLETTAIYDLGFVDPLRPVADKLGAALGIYSH